MTSKTKTAAAVAVLVLGFVAGPAQAQSRDSGVGQVIAVQGNVAVARIKAETKQAIRAWRPAVASARNAKIAREHRLVASAGGTGPAAASRCAP